jgi:TctA family transporter
MELFDHLATGFGVALTPLNGLYCFVGALLGTAIGVLPGIGPLATIAMLLPITFTLSPMSALIMLAGIYYGAQYGGSTTSILLNLPGESTTVVTCIDGYQMARRGRAGAALSIAALGSFFAGCVATLAIALFAPVLAQLALEFGPADYCSLMIFGLVGAVVLAQGSPLKAVASIFLGLLFGTVGQDINSGIERFTFGLPELDEGINVTLIAMGVFGFAEIITNLEQGGSRELLKAKISGLWPSRADFRASAGAVGRGTIIGSILGILPGGGALVASLAAYTLEKKISRDPSQFGRGAIAGVAAPESANNAAAQTSFIPLLTLGIPSNPVMAVMVGAMLIQGITPGPQVMFGQPELFWGLIASMWVGNLMLIVLNLPLIGIWIRLVTVPYRFLFPAILLFCSVGAYTLANHPLDIVLTAGFGLLGYAFVKLGCEPAPLLLGFVLGPLMEVNLRRAMLIERGDPSIFVTSPVSLGMLIAALVLLCMIILPGYRRMARGEAPDAEIEVRSGL